MSGSTAGSRIRRAAAGAGWTLLLTLLLGSILDARERSVLVREAERELALLRSLRTTALERYLESARSEVVLWSGHGPLRDALATLTDAWQALGARAEPTLRRLYVLENPYAAQGRERLVDAGDGSAYSAAHAFAQPRARRFLQTLGYYDLFLIDAEGNLVYSYLKEDDFATNLVDGRWSDTGLGRAFRQARSAAHPSSAAFLDFAPYDPSRGEPASFLASPVYDGDSTLIGVLAFQIPVERIGEIMHFAEGMGETGETYVVGRDLLMRSDSRFSDESTILRMTVDSEPVTRALAGETGVRRTTDYRGVDVLSAYGPFEFEGVRWALLAEKDLAEILQPMRRLRRLLLLAGALSVLLVGAASASALGERSRPILRSHLSDR